MKTNRLPLRTNKTLSLKVNFTLLLFSICYCFLSAQGDNLPQLLSQIIPQADKSAILELQIVNEKGKLETFSLINRGRYTSSDGTMLYTSYAQSTKHEHRQIHITHTTQKAISLISDTGVNFNMAVDGQSYKWEQSSTDTAQLGCLAKDHLIKQINNPKSRSTDDLLVYEVAITATPAYSAAHGNTHQDVLMSILSYINQVNTIYERELGIRLELVPSSEKLIFLDGGSNPFPNQINTDVLKHIEIVNDSIGIDNYDIGHLFRFGGGGLANSQVACTSNKAMGASGFEEAGNFYKLIAHEIGHQLGATHTWNSCTNSLNQIQRSPSSAMEPGSGTTIMSYGGLCGANNVSSQRDPYFHAISIEQIASYTRMGLGNTCAQEITEPNTLPVIIAVTPTDKSIPIGTPFTLKAEAMDSDGDILTYAWDNVDQDDAINLGDQTAFNPVFRSRIPTSIHKRYIPQLSTLANGSSDLSEPLITIERSVEFRLAVRDNHVRNGKVAMSDFAIRTDATAGAFMIMDDNIGQWKANTTNLVMWDVANTTNNNVDCQSVNIFIDYGGLLEFQDTLAMNVPNDGSHYVSIPDTVSSDARIMVSAADNIFFDISDAPFTISRGTNADFQVYTDTTAQSICSLDDISFSIFSESLNSFINPIRFTPIDLPDGMTASFAQNDIVPGSSTMMTLSFDSSIARGTKTIKVNAFAANSTSSEINFIVDIQNDNLDAVQLSTPLDGTVLGDDAIELAWNSSGNENYLLEISSDPTFDSAEIVQSQSSSAPSINASLPAASTYFWRVLNSNGCSTASISGVRAFGIKAKECTSNDSSSGTLTIGQAIDSISSIIQISEDFDISDISISDIKGLHSYVGDLTFVLIAPDGSRYTLLDQECNESKYFNFSTSIGGDRFRCGVNGEQVNNPLADLADLIGTSAMGNWELRVIDKIPGDGGHLEGWTLNLCKLNNPGTPQIVNMDTLKLKPASIATIKSATISFSDTDNTPNELTYILSSIPQNGYLIRETDTLELGGQFTQADIDNDRLEYHHAHSIEETDDFSIYLTDGEGSISEKYKVNIWINNSVSTNTILETFGIKVFPNPANEFINLQIKESFSSNLEISLQDINGRSVIQKSIAPFQSNVEIDIKNIPAGIWILKISDKEKTAIKKIIIL